eukprot:13350_1
MSLSNNSIGFLIWGLICTFIACFLMIYDDGCRNIFCKLYCVYLISQVVASILVIQSVINMEYNESYILEYIFFVLLTFGATLFIIIASIWILIPLNKYKLFKILICYILPIIYLIFLISLNFIPISSRRIAVFSYYLICELYLCLSLFILFYWFKKKSHIFISLNESKPYWNISFIFGLIAVSLSLINFIYPILVKYNIFTSEYALLYTLCIDSFICVPLIIPLFRHLDQIKVFTKWLLPNENNNNENDNNYSHQIDIDAYDRITWEQIFERNWKVTKKQWQWILFAAVLTFWHNVASNIAYMFHTQNEILWDVGHYIFPRNNAMQTTLEMIFWIGFIVSIIFILIPSFIRHPKILTMLILIRYLKVSGFIIILRTICYLSTSLPSPDDNCSINSMNYNPPTSWKQIFSFNNISDACGDLIFSGHVSLTFVMAICIIHYYYYLLNDMLLKVIVFGIEIIIVILITILVLMSRTHYTVDIFIALYTVPLLYHFIWYTLPDPIILNNNDCGIE